MRHAQVVLTWAKQLLAIAPGSADQRRTRRQSFKYPDGGDSTQSIGVELSGHVQTDLAAAIHLGSSQIRKVTTKFDSRARKPIKRDFRVAHSMNSKLALPHGGRGRH